MGGGGGGGRAGGAGGAGVDDNYLGMVTESIQLICGEIIPE